MIAELIIGCVCILTVTIAFNKAAEHITVRVDDLTTEMRGLRKDFIRLVEKLTVVENTYVTDKECEARRKDGSCTKTL